MTTTVKAREGEDFATYQPSTRTSGWNWYCLHCSKDDGRGWRWNRVDARRDAQTHVAGHQAGGR
jgi:hypothetical protein